MQHSQPRHCITKIFRNWHSYLKKSEAISRLNELQRWNFALSKMPQYWASDIITLAPWKCLQKSNRCVSVRVVLALCNWTETRPQFHIQIRNTKIRIWRGVDCLIFVSWVEFIICQQSATDKIGYFANFYIFVCYYNAQWNSLQCVGELK